MPEKSELERAESRIRIAWVLAVISGFLTLVFAVLSAQTGGVSRPGAVLQSYSILNLIDVAILFFFAFTVYHKSRAGATALALYWFGNVVFRILATPSFALVVSFIFLYFYVIGAKATFDRKRILSAVPSADSSAAA